MIDIYLRGADQETIDGALMDAALMTPEGDLGPGVYLDRIGPISTVTGYDAEGQPIVSTIPDYHANLRLDFEPSAGILTALAPVTIAEPSEPYRVWM